MKKVLFAGLLALAAALSAEPVQKTTVCPFCRGRRGPISLTPPNLGQHDGDVGVTPGVPFRHHRFDVKVASCPFCQGSGRRTRWSFKPASKEPPPEGFEPCAACWRAGAEKCRTCKGEGVVACRACGRNGAKPGWIKEEKSTGSHGSRHKKILVTPCPQCQGFGKVPCVACGGEGGAPCRKCKGEGVLPKKKR